MKRFTSAFALVLVAVAGFAAAAMAADSGVFGRLLQTTTTTTTTTAPTTTTTVATTTTTTTTTPTVTETVTPPPRPQFTVICHHAPPANAMRGRGTVRHITIRVRSRAVRGHVKHGDNVGRCNAQRSVTIHSNKRHVRKYHPGRTLRAELRAKKRRR